jgi:hypothetical protein
VFLKDNISKKSLSCHTSLKLHVTEFPNLQSLSLDISKKDKDEVSSSVTEILLTCNNLKELRISAYCGQDDWINIISILSKVNYFSLKTFLIFGFIPSDISFIKNFKNLQEIIFVITDDTVLRSIDVLSISQFCPKIKNISVDFIIDDAQNDEILDFLERITSCFKNLESLEIGVLYNCLFEKLSNIYIKNPIHKLKISDYSDIYDILYIVYNFEL